MTPLHYFGEFIRQVLAAVPLTAVRGALLLALSALLVWTLLLPRAVTTSGPDSSSPLANLKLWAALALIIQLAIYTFV